MALGMYASIRVEHRKSYKKLEGKQTYNQPPVNQPQPHDTHRTTHSIYHIRATMYTAEQKSIGRTGNDVQYSCHHNSRRFTFPHICVFVAFLCLPFISHTAYILTEDDNTFA